MKKGLLFFVTLFVTYNIWFANEIDANCKRYFDGCNNCARSVYGGDMACTMMACAQDQAPKCLEYFTQKTMHPSWDTNEDGVNDCEKEGTCDDSVDYTLPKSKACTREYMPVCAQPPMPKCPSGMMCIQVMPQPKTYGNTCTAEVENAKILYQWACLSETLRNKTIQKVEWVFAKVEESKLPVLKEKLKWKIDQMLARNSYSQTQIQLLHFIKSLME